MHKNQVSFIQYFSSINSRAITQLLIKRGSCEKFVSTSMQILSDDYLEVKNCKCFNGNLLFNMMSFKRKLVLKAT